MDGVKEKLNNETCVTEHKSQSNKYNPSLKIFCPVFVDFLLLLKDKTIC